MNRTLIFIALSIASTTFASGQNAPLAQQRMCAEQAWQIRNQFPVDTNEILEETNHFNSRDNVCYFVKKLTIWSPNFSISINVENAFERTFIGNFQEHVAADGAHMTLCVVEMRVCKSQTEFEQLLKQVMYRKGK